MATVRLHSVQEKQSGETILDIIFVHGLGGDHLGTWHPRNHPESYWPQWLAVDLRNTAVWSLDYPASATRWGSDRSQMGLLERSKNLLDYLSALGIGHKPIVFIAHSLGGLLVKQLLYTAETMGMSKWHPILENTKGIVFIATPHTGSGLSQLASATSFLSLPSHITRDLEKGSDYLQHLSEWFRQNEERLGIKVEAYHETEKLGPSLVVDSVSANPGVRGCVPVAVDGDHLSICKPHDRNELVYQGTLRFLKNLVNSLTRPPQRLRLYLVPGFESEFGPLLSILEGEAVWSNSEIIQEDAGRLLYGLSQRMMDGSRCHLMFVDIVASDRRRRELEQAIEVIRLSRSLGRGLPFKPIIVLHSAKTDFEPTLAKLKPSEQEALSRYFFIEQNLPSEQLSLELRNLHSRVVVEWLARPQSSGNLL